MATIPITPPREPMTEPCATFYLQHMRYWGVRISVVRHVSDLYNMKDAVANVLESIKKTDSEKAALEAMGRGLTKEVYTHYFDSVLAEMWLCRVVESFVTYIAELLALILEKYPKYLKNSDQVFEVHKIMEHSTMEEFIEMLTEKKVSSLSRRGYHDLSEYMKKTLKFDLTPADNQRELMEVYFEYRNLITHHSGIVTKKAAEKLYLYKAGEPLRLQAEDCETGVGVITAAVSDIDQRIIAQFGIEAPVMGKELLDRFGLLLDIPGVDQIMRVKSITP